MSGLTELKQFTRAKVAAHNADISTAESPLPTPPLSALRSLLSIKPDEIDIHLEGGEVLKPLGGLKVIHTPGHTPGSISLFAPQRRLLIVGDTINTRRKKLRLPPKMVSTSLKQTSSSITELARLDFDVLCAGHGQPLTMDARTRVLELIERNGN
jgi:glyoxylase-like metal-dependent hydrolase (beta-lactamase superfamily II)